MTRTFWLKNIVFFLVAAGFLLLTSLTQAAEPPRLIRIGVYDNPPKIFRDEFGQVTGLYGDILRYIATQENWQLVFVDGTFDDGMMRLESGQIDIMVDVAVSEERAARFDLTNETVLGSWGVVYTRGDVKLESFQDFDQKKIALLKSSVYFSGVGGIDRYVKAFDLDVEYVMVDEYDQVFSLLESGEVDAAVVSRISGLAAESKYPTIRATNIIFSPTELRFALTKGDVDNPELIAKLDSWVKKLKDGHDGVFEEILKKHNLTGLITKVVVIPSWIYPVIITGVVIIFFALLAVIGLRRARRLALLSLEKTDRYLREVVNNTPVILSAIDKDGVITMAEGQALETLGLKSKQIIGQSVFELYKDNPNILKHTKIALSGKTTHFKADLDGRIFDVTAIPLKNSKNQLEVVSVSVDTTEDGKLEKAKAHFLRLVQHQLRTPPTAVRWASELLDPILEKTLKGEELELWSTLKSANDRMINLANALSLVSEITAGNFALSFDKVNLRVAVEDVLASYKKIIHDKKLKITIDTDNLSLVQMDKHLLGVVLQTLIANAIIYCDKNTKIKIKFLNKANSYILEVQDHGWGILETDKPRVFSQFFRSEEANRTNPDGLGMALHTTQTILTLLGGKIWFTSTAGKGSTFFVELPKIKIKS